MFSLILFALLSLDMNAHQTLIEEFYTAFARLDYVQMAVCYHPEVHFSDPVFPDLKGQEAIGMWHMLCERAKGFSLTYDRVWAEGDKGGCHWQAEYLFSATGRKVTNQIEAKFIFEDGKMIRHQDKFDFYKWSQMALGTSGLLLGWTPFLRNKVCNTAAGNLESFMKKKGY